MTFKFIDLFCGLGGFRIAFQKVGGKCVFSCDIDKAVRRTYAINFGETPQGDITKIESKDIPNHEMTYEEFNKIKQQVYDGGGEVESEYVFLMNAREGFVQKLARLRGNNEENLPRVC